MHNATYYSAAVKWCYRFNRESCCRAIISGWFCRRETKGKREAQRGSKDRREGNRIQARPVFPSGSCHKIGDNVEIRCDFNDVKWKSDQSERNGCKGKKHAHTQQRLSVFLSNAFAMSWNHLYSWLQYHQKTAVVVSQESACHMKGLDFPRVDRKWHIHDLEFIVLVCSYWKIHIAL